MDSKELKYKNWVMTWNAMEDGTLVAPSVLKKILEDSTLDYVFQKEKGTTGDRMHYQGTFKTRIRVRKNTLLNMFALCLSNLLYYEDIPASPEHVAKLIQQLTFQPMAGTWEQSVEYCTKSETAEGEPVASFSIKNYDGSDVKFLSDKFRRYPWQNSLMEKLFDEAETSIKVADGRTVIWVYDPHGNSGKSKLVKYICITNTNCIKVAFGTAGQLRSSVISAGPRDIYFIDMPRTLGDDDSVHSLVAVLEDVLNGFVCTNFHGKYSQLVMSPPHVVVFSNQHPPLGMMSEDRWQSYRLDKVTKTLEKM